MIRRLEQNDYELLATSLLTDEYHSETPPEFFYDPDAICNVYEDDDGLVLFLRGQAVSLGSDKKIIRLDIQYLNNNDFRRNMKTMLEEFPKLEENARQNGFSGFVFHSTSPLLRKFCIKRLGFQDGPCDLLYKAV
jgi:hypothetical protein